MRRKRERGCQRGRECESKIERNENWKNEGELLCAGGLGGVRQGERGKSDRVKEKERKREKRECGGTIVDSESHLASRLLFIVPCYSGFPRQSGRDAV